jgi:hypothetical protein
MRVRGRATDRLGRFCFHRCRNAQVNRLQTRWDEYLRFHQHKRWRRALDRAASPDLQRGAQFEPVSEAGRLWAVWSEVDWLDAVWS